MLSKNRFLSWYLCSTTINYDLEASHRHSCLFDCRISILVSQYYPILNRRILLIHGGCGPSHPRGSRICPSSSVSRFTAVTFYQRLSVMTGGDFSDTPRFPYRHPILCPLYTLVGCPFDSSNNSPFSTSLTSCGAMSAVADIVVDPLCRTCHR